MEGTISLVAKVVEDGDHIELNIQLRDVSNLNKLRVVENICRGLKTSLEELIVIRKLAEVCGIES